MTVKSGQAITVLFATSNATTGAAEDATVGPVGTLYVDGVPNAAAVTVTNLVTGVYKAALTLPALTAGQVASLRIAATVGVAAEGIVWQDVSDTAIVSDAQAILSNVTYGNSALATLIGDVPTTTELGTALTNLDVAVSSRSTLMAADVWAYGTRTLSSFGSLVADVAAGVWSAVSRTLTSAADSAGVTTLLARIIGTLAAGTHTAQTGDAFARLGAPAGASVSADVAVIDAVVDAIRLKTDALDTAQFSVVSGIVGDELVQYVGATFDETVPGLTIPANWIKVAFTVKGHDSDAETAALEQVVASNPADGDDGLVRLNGAEADDAGQGALTVDQAAGRVRIVVHMGAMAQMTPHKGRWDLKVFTDDEPEQGWPLVVSSPATIGYTTTRRTS